MSEGRPESISEFLRQVDKRWQEHEELGRDALRFRGDFAGFTEHVEAQAQLLIGLPDKIAALRDAGMDVPLSVGHFAEYLSEEATYGRDIFRSSTGSSFLIQSMLHGPDEDIDSPSILERLAIRYERADST